MNARVSVPTRFTVEVSILVEPVSGLGGTWSEVEEALYSAAATKLTDTGKTAVFDYAPFKVSGDKPGSESGEFRVSAWMMGKTDIEELTESADAFKAEAAV